MRFSIYEHFHKLTTTGQNDTQQTRLSKKTATHASG